MKTKKLKVSRLHRRRYYTAVPFVKISGRWLAEFVSIGDTISVKLTQDEIIIKKHNLRPP